MAGTVTGTTLTGTPASACAVSDGVGGGVWTDTGGGASVYVRPPVGVSDGTNAAGAPICIIDARRSSGVTRAVAAGGACNTALPTAATLAA